MRTHDSERDASSDSAATKRSAVPPQHPGLTSVGGILALQATAGNAAVVQLLRQAGHPGAQDRHQHGPACGHHEEGAQVQRSAQEHGPVADDSPAGQKALLDQALASPSRALPEPLLAAATPFFQNPNLAAARLHDNPLAQRATAALGAQAMTVGTHIFAPPRVVADKKVMIHELSHVNENLRGTPETGNNNGAGVTITDPHQGSEQKAERDGASFGAGATTAPSVVTQRAVTRDVDTAAVNQGASTADAAVQRMESPPRGRRGSEDYEADASDPGSAPDRDSDSSPERRELLERIERELAAGPSLDDLAEQAERLEMGHPGFRRVRGVHDPDQDQDRAAPQSESESEYESDPPATAAAAPVVVEPLPELPENPRLAPLRDLLKRELRKGGVDKKLKVTFSVDAGDRDPRVASGHAWIEITGSRGKQTSFGFYPEQEHDMLSNVRGGVHCPDGYSLSGRATHHESKNVALKDIVNGYLVAHDRSGAHYNLTLHNCSTFAGDVWKTMTGKAIPREWFTAYGLLGTVVSTPHGAAEGLEGHQERRRQRRRERARPLVEGPLRGLMPGPGDADEVADRLARAKLSQSSSSPSSEEVD